MLHDYIVFIFSKSKKKKEMDFKTQLKTDKFAATISLACAIHCFFVPSFVIVTSGVLFTSIDNELIHKIILLIAIPVSLYALRLGYKNHKILSFLFIGIGGLLILVSAVILGENFLGESGEKITTLTGSILVCYAHFKNHQTCKTLECSSCHD